LCGINFDAACVPLHRVRNGKGRFYGYGKNFSAIFVSRLAPTFYTASFLSAISTPDANFLKIKKPIEFSQWAKSSACLISEAGAVVLKGDSVGLCLFHGTVLTSNELWGQFSLSRDSLRPEHGYF
jgi:hypothetical protein